MPETDIARVENTFTYHAPFGDQVERYEEIRDDAKSLAYSFMVRCPPSRELSLALTNLEQAVFWANAAIARNEKEEVAAAEEPTIDNNH